MIDWVNRLSKHRLFIILFIVLFSLLLCITVVAVGLLYRCSEQVAEQKLQECITSLKEEGDYIIEEHSFSDFHIGPDHVLKERDFTDFHQAVSTSGIDHVYYDRGRHLLYFIRPKGDGIEAEVFNYKWKISDLFT